MTITATVEPDVARRVAWPALAAIVLIAATLRFAPLGQKDLWLDECVSAVAAEGTVAETVRNVAREDAHPPLYYVALNLTTRLTGSDEVGLRALSAAASTGVIVLVYALGAMLLGRVPALLAAGAMAVSCFQLYFAQEARLYALATLLIMAMTCVLARMLTARNASPRATALWAAAYGVLTVMALYTYYYALFAVAAHAVAFGVLWLCGARRPEPAGRWLLTGRRAAEVWPMLLAAVVFAGAAFAVGWGRVVLAQLQRFGPLPSKPYELSSVGGALQQFMTGPVADLAAPRLDAVAALVLLAALPLVGGWCALRRRPGAALFLLLSLLVPFVGVLFVKRLHVFEAKHLVFVSPVPFLLLAAAWTLPRARALAVVALVLVVISNGALDHVYLRPNCQKEDWRGAVARVGRHASPRDVIVVSPSYAVHAFRRYYAGPLPIFPVRYPEELTAVLGRHPRGVWLVELQSRVAFPSPAVAARLASETAGPALPPGEFPGFTTAPTMITVRYFLETPEGAR